MRTRIINYLLLMALFVSSMGTIVSCKDYDEDIYTDLRGRLDGEATLREALEAQLKTLQDAVKNMQAHLDTIKSCKCDLSKYLTEEDLAKYGYLTPEDLAKYGYLTGDDLTNLLSRVADLEAAKALMENRVDSIVNVLASLNVPNIDTLENHVVILDQQIIIAQTNAEEALRKAEEALRLAQQHQGGESYDDTELRNMINSLQNLVNGLKTTVENLTNRVQAVEGVAADALAKAEAAQATANANLISIVTMKEQIANIQDWIKNHKDYEDGLKDLEKRVKAIEDTYATKAQVDEAKKLAENANKAIASLRDSIKNGNIVRLDQLRDSLEKYTSKKEFKDSIKVLRDSIDKFSTRIKACENAIDSLNADIQNMITGIIVQGTQSPVIGYFNAPLDTRATILAVYYGTPAAAWSFPSKVAANYVKAEDINKWTARNVQVVGANFENIEGVITDGAAGKTIVTQKNGSIDGNAGTLYVTVNPANVNFTDTILKLKDSKDADAPMTLSKLAYSERQLTFGYTRAGAKNGFYEAQATLKAEDVDKAKMNIDFNALKEDVQTMMNERSKSSVLELGATLIRNSQNILPAYGVMGTWKDKSTGTIHPVYSQYNVAATAVRPLSFSFMQGYKISSMPGLDRVQNLVGEIIDKINININLGLPDFAKYKGSITFKNVTLPTISDDMFRIQYTKTYTSEDLAGDGKLYGDYTDTDLFFLVTNVKDGRYALVSTDANGNEQKLWIYDPTTKTYHEATATEQAAWGAIEFGLTVDVDINKTPDIKNTLQDIVNNLNSQFGENSDLAKNITSLLNDVSSLGNIDSKINDAIFDAKGDIKSTINSYITKLNNRLTNWFNRAPGILHLTMIGGSNGNIGMLSQAKKMPTKATGELTLLPTSYNLELLAPAYKKVVVVTDVFNADGTNADIQKAKDANSNGENLAKVIDSEKTCKLTGESGYIYEITYTAVDYFGKVAIRKYYVRF